MNIKVFIVEHLKQNIENLVRKPTQGKCLPSPYLVFQPWYSVSFSVIPYGGKVCLLLPFVCYFFLCCPSSCGDLSCSQPAPCATPCLCATTLAVFCWLFSTSAPSVSCKIIPKKFKELVGFTNSLSQQLTN